MRGEFEVTRSTTGGTSYAPILDLTGSGILYWAMFKGATGNSAGWVKLTIDDNVIELGPIDSGDILVYFIPDSSPDTSDQLNQQNTFDALCMLNIEYQDNLKLEIKNASGGGQTVYGKIAYAVDTGSLESANTELASIPTTVSSLREMIQYLFQEDRNKSTMNKDTGVETLYKEDASTPLGSRTHADDGTTWTKPEMS